MHDDNKLLTLMQQQAAQRTASRCHPLQTQASYFRFQSFSLAPHGTPLFPPLLLLLLLLLLSYLPQGSAVSRLRLANIRDHQEQLQDDPAAQLSRVRIAHMLYCTACLRVVCACPSFELEGNATPPY
jgi:hypothetical protein